MHARQATLKIALIPVAALVSLLTLNVVLFGDDATSGPNQIALLVTAALTAGIGVFWLGLGYKTLEKQAIRSIGLAMQANLILLVVGIVIGLWIAAGIVPTLIYYGIVLINPKVFLLVACLACSMVSVSIGSSWSTMGTIGVALIGVGQTLGMPLGLVAGAIVSGAYFGDKLSPLSDTTNLAPAAAGTELFTHVRHLLYTTVPAYVLSLLGFAVLGLIYGAEAEDPAFVAAVTEAIQAHFNIGLHTLITPVAVFVLILKRTPALPALLAGAFMGAAQALLFQSQLFVGDGGFSLSAAYIVLMETAHSGFSLDTGNELIDDLFSRGGLLNMLNTVLLIIMAMLFGGAMEATGLLQEIARSILQLVRGTASLVAATIGTCMVFNLTASDQYLAIVVPGRMFRSAFRERKLAPQNLSRCLEDGGTVTSVLVPWNTCGAFAATVLAVPTLSYAPWTLFCLLCPLMSVLLATLGIGQTPLDPSEVVEEA